MLVPNISFAKLDDYTGTASERFLKYLIANTTALTGTLYSIGYAENEFLKQQLSVTTSRSNSDMWKEYLDSEGYSGSLTEMFLQWLEVSGPTDFNWQYGPNSAQGTATTSDYTVSHTPSLSGVRSAAYILTYAAGGGGAKPTGVTINGSAATPLYDEEIPTVHPAPGNSGHLQVFLTEDMGDFVVQKGGTNAHAHVIVIEFDVVMQSVSERYLYALSTAEAGAAPEFFPDDFATDGQFEMNQYEFALVHLAGEGNALAPKFTDMDAAGYTSFIDGTTPPFPAPAIGTQGTGKKFDAAGTGTIDSVTTTKPAYRYTVFGFSQLPADVLTFMSLPFTDWRFPYDNPAIGSTPTTMSKVTFRDTVNNSGVGVEYCIIDSTDTEVSTWQSGTTSGTTVAWNPTWTVSGTAPYRRKARFVTTPDVEYTDTQTFVPCTFVTLDGQSNNIRGFTVAAITATEVTPTGYNTEVTTSGVNTPAHGVASFMNELSTLIGVPVVALRRGAGGQPAYRFDDVVNPSENSDNTNIHDAYVELLDYLSLNGDVQIDIAAHTIQQGEAAQADAYANRLSDLVSWRDAVTGAHTGMTASLCQTFLCTIGAVEPPNGNSQVRWQDMRDWDKLIADTGTGDEADFQFGTTTDDRSLEDDFHFYGESYKLVLDRLAERIGAERFGTTDTLGRFQIASAAVVNATTVDLTLSDTGSGTDIEGVRIRHDQGSADTEIRDTVTDFGGIELSDDGGSTWTSAIGVRQSTSTVRVTHALAGTVNRVRYLYGRKPDVGHTTTTSGLIINNNGVPLEFTSADGIVVT